jgi:hypothetical protein
MRFELRSLPTAVVCWLFSLGIGTAWMVAGAACSRLGERIDRSLFHKLTFLVHFG